MHWKLGVDLVQLQAYYVASARPLRQWSCQNEEQRQRG